MPAPEHEPDERDLVEAARSDRRRFGALYERHFDRVYAYAARRVGGRAEAEDVTSEVFQRALAHIDRFEWRETPFAAWLLRIASNAIADRRARADRERGDPAAAEPAAESGPDLEEIERRARLALSVERLPADQRRVVVARFVERRDIQRDATAWTRNPRETQPRMMIVGERERTGLTTRPTSRPPMQSSPPGGTSRRRTAPCST